MFVREILVDIYLQGMRDRSMRSGIGAGNPGKSSDMGKYINVSRRLAGRSLQYPSERP